MKPLKKISVAGGQRLALSPDEEPESVRRAPVQVRLKHNLIADGKHYPRGSIVDIELLPEKLRTSELITDVRTGSLVMLLVDVIYDEKSVNEMYGNDVTHQVTLGKYSVVDLDKLPAETRARLVEGEDFQRDYNEVDRLRLLSSPYGGDDEFEELIGEAEDSGPARRPLLRSRK